MFTFLAALTVSGQPGNIDSAFGTDGIVTTALVEATESGYDATLLPDGRILVAGYWADGSKDKFAVARFEPNGALDTTFGDRGFAIHHIGLTSDQIRTMANLQDGRILVGGVSTGNFYDFAVARYLPEGILDSTFGVFGSTIIHFGGVDEILALGLQSDGRIIAAGYSSVVGTGDFVTLRFDTLGNIDPDFGTSGFIVTDFGNPIEYGRDLVIQSDDKIVLVGGTASTGFNGDFTLVRHKPDGSYDSTFNGTGKVVTSFGQAAELYAVALQPDGKIVAGGSTRIGGQFDFAVARYDSTGTLDNSFGSNGLLNTDFNGDFDRINDIVVQPDGKILAAGRTITGVNEDFALVRYDSDGSLDNTFGTNGRVATEIGPNTDMLKTVLLQPDNRVIAAGYASNGKNLDFALARYNTDGSLDNTFGTGGKVLAGLGSDDHAGGVVIRSNGSVLVGGSAQGDFAATRYLSSGTLDVGFHFDGIATFPVNGMNILGTSTTYHQVEDKLILAGIANGGSGSSFGLARVNPFGSIDNSFGTNGIVITGFGTNAGANSVTMQPDGKIVAAGFTDGDFALARYSTSGSLDVGFSSDGKVTTSVGSGADVANAVAVQSDGKIVASGRSFNGTKDDIAIVRYNTDGTLDNTFSSDGIMTVGISSQDDVANAVAAQQDGKIVVAGGSGSSVFVARYNPDGTPDNTFNSTGVVITSVGTASMANAMAIQSDDKIVIAGASDDEFLVARYLKDGTLDTAFSTDGILTIDIGPLVDVAHAVGLQSNGNIVAAGTTFKGADHDFAVVRVLASLDQIGLVEFGLSHQNIMVYPNPISRTAILELELAKQHELSIELLDASGRKVSTLLPAEIKSAGNHTIPITFPSNLDAGNYVISIISAYGSAGIQVVKL